MTRRQARGGRSWRWAIAIAGGALCCGDDAAPLDPLRCADTCCAADPVAHCLSVSGCADSSECPSGTECVELPGISTGTKCGERPCCRDTTGTKRECRIPPSTTDYTNRLIN